jgi:AbiV family abortive infection protein
MTRANALKALNVFGLAASLGGVILLFRYGMPYRIPMGGYSILTPDAPDPTELATEHHYLLLGWLGLGLIVIGTAAQIIATLFSPLKTHRRGPQGQRGQDMAQEGRSEMAVTPQYILRGYAYALEQCGLLLRDANVLYEKGSYASTVALTAFAREELGRSSIYLDLWRRASAGESFTIEQLRQACDDHVAKQKAGMLSLTMRTHRDSGLGKILSTRMTADPQSPERHKANADLKRIDEIKGKRTPSDRHEKRMAALYVDPISETEWNRPGITSASSAYEFLEDAHNDYSGRYGNGYVQPSSSNEILKELNPDLHDALEQWSNRPTLALTSPPKGGKR